MKRFLITLGALGAPAVAITTDDVWSTTTTAVGTAVSNVGTLLVAIIAIPVAFVGFRVVKRAVKGA